jgi:hypothetical protein
VDQIYPSWAKRPPDHASDPNGRGHRRLRVLAEEWSRVVDGRVLGDHAATS